MIVAFEGVNFSGKTTQALALVTALRSRGHESELFEFPSRGTPIGSLLRAAMRRDLSLPVEALFALFAANRLERRLDILAAADQGRVSVCDRYSGSEYAYGAAYGLDRGWLRAIESRMPPPDLVVLLDISYHAALERRTPNSPLDIFEQDKAFLETVREEYLALARTAEGTTKWAIVDATPPAEVVQESVERVVANALDLPPG